jgi:hypothetical protein
MIDRNETDLTRGELRELLDETREALDRADGEAQAYLSLLVPILHRMGGETTLTTADALAVPDGVCVWTEQTDEDEIRIWVGTPRKD